jgi:hypothetical protein
MLRSHAEGNKRKTRAPPELSEPVSETGGPLPHEARGDASDAILHQEGLYLGICVLSRCSVFADPTVSGKMLSTLILPGQ